MKQLAPEIDGDNRAAATEGDAEKRPDAELAGLSGAAGPGVEALRGLEPR